MFVVVNVDMRDFSFTLALVKGSGRVAFKIISRLSLKSSRVKS